MAKVLAEKKEDDKDKAKYLLLFATFQKLIESWQDSAGKWEVLEELITLRASSLLENVLEGLKLDFDSALNLLRSRNDFMTLKDKEQRDILVAAIDNLVDFAAAQENTMLGELPKEIDTLHPELYESLFERYNKTFARQEDKDILYAATIAAWWMTQSSDTLVTFMTQGDERVRAWHLSLEGITYPKQEFPAELIPPIEHGCRCFLLTQSSASNVIGKLDPKAHPIDINPVFRESLALKGKIFSQEHSYFKRPLPIQVQNIVKRIKTKLYLCQN